jgi:hypothetical protein
MNMAKRTYYVMLVKLPDPRMTPERAIRENRWRYRLIGETPLEVLLHPGRTRKGVMIRSMSRLIRYLNENLKRWQGDGPYVFRYKIFKFTEDEGNWKWVKDPGWREES